MKQRPQQRLAGSGVLGLHQLKDGIHAGSVGSHYVHNAIQDVYNAREVVQVE